MIDKYERLTTEKDIEDKDVAVFKEVEKKEATHKHICGHDEVPPRPCRRVKL